MNPGTLKAGSVVRLTAGAGQDTRMGVSRDGKKVAFTTKSEAIRLWLYRLDAVTGRITGSAEPVTDPTMALPAYPALARPMAANWPTPLPAWGREGGSCGSRI
jgi:hypothetical protein